MQDGRVNPIYKLLPVGSLLYLLNPFDIIGPIDDAFVIWLGSSLFVELVPQEIVQELRAELEPVGKNPDDGQPPIEEKDIIDADYTQ